MPRDTDAPNRLLRVVSDDPKYRRQAAAEAEFWRNPHPYGLEETEELFGEGPIERYVNKRRHWVKTVARWCVPPGAHARNEFPQVGGAASL